MSVTLIDTPGAIDANSFCDSDYADAYWETRNSEIWDDVESKDGALINATRALVRYFLPRREYFPAEVGVNGRAAFFFIHSTWTGAPASTTQKLPWPRIGMYDINGNLIPSTVVPDELKDVTSELAGQMSLSDRMLDFSTVAKGIQRLKTGPVEIEYKNGIPLIRLLPDIIKLMLIPSWLTEEFEESTRRALFDVVSN